MQKFGTLGKRKIVLGVIHLPPLPGTPFYEEGSFNQTLDMAVQSACALYNGGADGCLVETIDRIYSPKDEADFARTIATGLVVQAITQATGKDFQIGVQLMWNALKASLAIAKVAGGTFIRASALVGRTSTVYGVVEANPLDVMEYRNKIHAQNIKIIAEVDSMHFKWLGEPKPTAEVAKAAKYVGADAVSLGNPNDGKTLEMVNSVRKAALEIPIILSGHTNHENAARLLSVADGAFVGSCFERDFLDGQIDIERVKTYVDIVRQLEE